MLEMLKQQIEEAHHAGIRIGFKVGFWVGMPVGIFLYLLVSMAVRSMF